MAGQNHYQDEWDNWDNEPQPATGNRWLLGLLIGAAAVCLVAACGVGGYYLVWPSLAQPTLPPIPAIPTLPGAPETATAVAAATAGAPPPDDATVEPATALPLPSTGVTAARTADAPAIEGSLAEYGAAPAVPSAFRVYSAAGWDGSADLNATWRLLWDAQNLYVGVVVVDDLHVQTQTGNQMYRGDSLEMQIDTAPAANASRVNGETYQLILSPGNFSNLAPAAFRFRGTDEGSIVDAPGHQIQVAAQQTADGYTLEAAIPWADLDVNPAEGMQLGLALNANDNDRPGQAIQEVMLSHVSTRTLTNPRSWGTLTLE